MLALVEGVIYDEEQLSGSKGGIEVVGDLTSGSTSRHFSKRDFMACSESAVSAQSVFGFKQVCESKEDEEESARTKAEQEAEEKKVRAP